MESETATGNQACDETSGVVLKHNQQVISAFFHSTSGGATEVGENVWGKEIPYVQSVVDYDDNSPHFSWQRRFSVDQAEKTFGLKTGSLLNIHPFWKVASNRVKQAAVVSLDNTTVVTGERLRQLFKLPSSIFNVSFEDNNYAYSPDAALGRLGSACLSTAPEPLLKVAIMQPRYYPITIGMFQWST